MCLMVFAFLLLVGIAIVFAQDEFILRLDQLMTPAEQKHMGITKLNHLEHEALEQWLTNRTIKVRRRATISSGLIYAGVGDGHWVLKKIDGGRFIKLEDGSL